MQKPEAQATATGWRLHSPDMPAMHLYPRRNQPLLELFRDPPREYRGTPFWCWNDRLDRSQLLRQIDVMQRMGFGGFHIHSRTGLATEYLGPTWMDLVKMCVDEADRRNQLCWLYDEDRWPSGYAGGLATKDLAFRQRHLLWTRIPYGHNAPRGKSDYTAAVRNETGRLVARYDVELDSDFRLTQFRRLRDDETPSPDRVIWHAYIEPATPSTWFNGQTAVDTFSRRAIERFIETTHERYREAVGDRFGTVIPAFFTDEPQFVKKSMFARGNEQHDLFMPISEDFFDTYRRTFGQDLLDSLPELFWNLQADVPSVARYRYHEHTAERFASAFSDTLGEWCGRNGVALTGHMLGEANLMSQSRGCGEAMRGLRAFHLPGVDMLCDKRELTTVLQARSVARQMGREGVASELYGVTGWHFDFVGHKAQGDWQAALGVTVRVAHLFWMSMRGEAKRDYPASIGEQSPWFEEYKLIEDHFARIATVMTRGKPATRVGVIHPIESAWLHWGPTSQNTRAVTRLEETFTQLPQWLLFGNVNFDYIGESTLGDSTPATFASGHPTFRVGEMNYDCVIVPPTITLRSTTLDALERFADSGGTILFAGEVAACVDACTSNRAATLAARCRCVPFDREALLDTVSPWTDVAIEDADRSSCKDILHQLRIDGDKRYLFLVNTCRTEPRSVRIRVRGEWTMTELDTVSGDARPTLWARHGGMTMLEHEFPPHGHLLLSLEAGLDHLIDIHRIDYGERAMANDPVAITLSEPNVLLLDRPRFRITGDNTWSDSTDILRSDNLIRTRLGLPPRNGRNVQPWADKQPAPVLANVELLFAFESDTDLPACQLAMENPEDATIHIDGTLISNVPVGWWVDQAISRVALPAMRAGTHELRLTIPFTRRTELEAVYLLGDFGVRVGGSQTRIVDPVRSLAWGDWTSQGLPFYGGNVTYHVTMPAGRSPAKLRFPRFSNPLLSVSADSRRLGPVAFAPFEIAVPQDARQLDITAFGNRANTFGPLHHPDVNLKWIGPNAWRTSGDQWTDDYVLRPTGILSAPILLEEV